MSPKNNHRQHFIILGNFFLNERSDHNLLSIDRSINRGRFYFDAYDLRDKLFKLLPIKYTCTMQNDVVVIEEEKSNEISIGRIDRKRVYERIMIDQT